MALNNKLKTLETRFDNERVESEPESDQDLDELESDVKKMSEKILEYRATIPDQLKTTLASILSTQRLDSPHIDDGSDPGPSTEHNADSEEMEEKIRLLKCKTSSNISTMPIVSKRMKECISRIEKLESCDGVRIMDSGFEKTKLVDRMKIRFQV